MTDWIVWFVLAGTMVTLEIFTGTFYLLMIAIGLASGGAAAIAGADNPVQLLCAAIVGIAATILLRRSRLGKPEGADVARDPNVNLDIGQTIAVPEWRSSGGGANARVMYRGAMWDIELAEGAIPQPGVFAIQEVRGSRLIVTNYSGNR